MSNPTLKNVHLELQPGHAIRRLHQISVAFFSQETHGLGITPVQYAILQMVYNHPGFDQRTLARNVALDTSTTAGVVDRLEARGLLTRSAAPDDRRVRLLTLTPAGEQLLADAIAPMERAQTLMLAPLTPAQRDQFMQLMALLVTDSSQSQTPGGTRAKTVSAD